MKIQIPFSISTSANPVIKQSRKGVATEFELGGCLPEINIFTHLYLNSYTCIFQDTQTAAA